MECDLEAQRSIAIHLNKEMGNYSKDYCEKCGREMDIYNSRSRLQRYYEVGKICEECES